MKFITWVLLSIVILLSTFLPWDNPWPTILSIATGFCFGGCVSLLMMWKDGVHAS